MSVFIDSATQWRHAGLAGVPVGLDYRAVETVCRARRVRFGAILDKLRVLEGAALEVFAERAARLARA